MKRLLAFCVSVVLVLSLAAVSLAAPEITSEFRYEVCQRSNADGDFSVLDNTDYRLNCDGDITENIMAHFTMRMQVNIFGSDPQYSTSTTLDDDDDDKDNADHDNFSADEFYLLFKYPFAEIKYGYYEYVTHPSRLIAKACDSYILVQKNTSMLTAKIPIRGNFYGGLATILNVRGQYFSEDAYDYSLGYTDKKWGTVIHYFDNKGEKLYNILDSQITYDVYYDWTPNFRLYAFGTCPEYGVKEHGQYEDEAVLGLRFNNVFKTKLFAAFEYDVLGRTVTTGTTSKGVTKYNETKWDRAPYGIILKYPLFNKIGLEFEHTNINATNDVKNLLRFTTKF